jgi:hypothetical protein
MLYLKFGVNIFVVVENKDNIFFLPNIDNIWQKQMSFEQQ